MQSDLQQVYKFKKLSEFKFSLRCCLMNLPNPYIHLMLFVFI